MKLHNANFVGNNAKGFIFPGILEWFIQKSFLTSAQTVKYVNAQNVVRNLPVIEVRLFFLMILYTLISVTSGLTIVSPFKAFKK